MSSVQRLSREHMNVKCEASLINCTAHDVKMEINTGQTGRQSYDDEKMKPIHIRNVLAG